ncbi:MAG: restriction endonuclease subunit S [Bacteroidales bacterium]|nr:restriction endonuclease subunit S [Bacteroidales bacterium]
MSKEKLIPELRFPEFKDSGEWDVKTLGEVLIKNSKKNKNQKYSQVESVSNKFGFIKQDEYFKNRRVASKDTSNYYVIKKGYFAYNPSRIDVGSLAYKHNDEISIISPLYVSFKANNELINDYFLLSFFNSVTFTKQMIFEGGVRNTLNYDNLIQSKIPIPTIQEQQRIASCLSSLDEVIEAHSKKLELLKDHKKGLLQNLFPQEGETVPKVRFPEFEEDGEWELKPFSKFIKLYRGSSPRPIREYLTKEETGVNWIKIGDTSSITDFVIRSVSEKITPKGAEKSRRVKKGELILANSMSYGSTYLLEVEGCIYDGWFVLREYEEHFDKQFLLQLLNSEYTQGQYKRFAAGGIVQNISSEIVYSITLSKTSKEEQQKIGSCLSAVDELITAQQEKIEQLQQHKKGLMQGLFPKIND